MTQTSVDQSTLRWRRTTRQRLAERRPLERQAEIAAACSTATLRTLVDVVRTTESRRRLGLPARATRI